MADTNHSKKQELLNRLNGETSKIAWTEMQKFFADGSTIYVDASLDLVDTAAEMALDNTELLEGLMSEGKVAPVVEEQALQWFEQDFMVWAVVVPPWVLIQPVDNTASKSN